MCGHENMLWEDIGFFATWFLHNWEDTDLSLADMAGLKTASYWWWYQQVGGENRSSLAEVLRAGRLVDVDPSYAEDRVNAVLGLAEKDAASLARVGNVQKSYTDAARYMIRKEGTLQALSFVQHQGDQFNEELPSWVADWRDKESPAPLWLPGAMPEMNFAAGPQIYTPPVGGDKETELTVRGASVDSIAMTYASIPKDGLSCRMDWNHLASVIFKDITSVMLSRKHSDREILKILTEQSRVLTAGRDSDGNTSTTRHLEGYCMFLSHVLDSRNGDHRPVLEVARKASLGASHEDEQTYMDLVALHSTNRKLFRTKKGHLGIGPTLMKKGDKVCIFSGGIIPFLIRQTQKDGKQINQLVGPAYIDGYMCGEKRYEAIFQDEPFILT
jgi:hypothetical protein